MKAIAVGADYFNSAVETAAYTIAIKLPAPAVSLAAGTYYGTQRATVTDSNAGATIYFTLDGTTPTSASTHYTGPVVIAKSESLKAIAIASGYTSSTVTTLAYNIITVLPAPKVSVAAGTYASTQTVTLTDAAPDAMIFYTTNGVAPTASSIRYTIPIQVTATETIRAVAIQSGATASPAIAEAYIIETAAATPTASVASGTYSASQKVTLSDATAGAAIYYTMNGTTPTTSSTKYTAPIAVTASETLKAIAVLAGHTNSGVASVAYTIETPAANPTFSKAAGAYSASQTVTITDATGGATIYYTTNGTVPTTSSTKYTGPIAVAKSEKVQAIAVLAGHTNSGVVAVSYTIN